MISVPQIKRAVAANYRLPLEVIEGAALHRTFSVPRQLVMFLAVRVAGIGPRQVARRMNRHHSTVIFGVSATETRISTDADFRARAARIIVGLTAETISIGSEQPIYELAA